MATVTLAQCWYFIQDVLQLEDGGFDRWHRLSFFIHPILLIVCPVFNFVRLVGRWLLFLILLPFRTVGGAIVLVGRGANKFADQCRTFVVFISEFYEVPSRESDAQIGGYIVLPFSSGLRVLVLAKEEEDEEDDDEEEYEDCVPLLEGGDEKAVETFLLEDVKLTLEASDDPRDGSPLPQAEDFSLARTKNDPKDATQPFLSKALSFRFHRNVPLIEGEGYGFAYKESSQMESTEQEEEEEEEPVVQVAKGDHVDYVTAVTAGDGDDEDEYATHVSEQRNLTIYHAPSAPMASPSHGFLDKAGHGGRGLSVDVEGGREEAIYTPRRSRHVTPRSIADVAQESRHRRRTEVEKADRSDGWRDSPRSVLEAAQESRYGRRREVEENTDRFPGSRVTPRSVLEAAQELRQGRRREVEEEEDADWFRGSRVSPRSVPEPAQEGRRNRRKEADDVDSFYGSRVSPRSVPEAAQEVRRDRRKEADDVDSLYGSRVSPRSVPEAAQEVRRNRRKEADDVDSLYGSRVSPRSVPEAAQEVRRNRRKEADEVDPFYSSRVSPRSVPEVRQELHGHGASRHAEEGRRFYASYKERVEWFDLLNAERRSTVSVIWSITLRSTSLQERIEPLDLSCRGAVPKKLVKSLESDFEAIYVGQTCLCWEALHYQYRKVQEMLFQDSSLTVFDATIANMFQQFEISTVRFIESEMFCGDRFWNFAHRRFSDKILLQIPDVSDYNVRGRQREEIVTANQLLQTIESAIRHFWYFIRSDDRKEPSPWKHPWTDCPVENPRDLKILSQIKKDIKEKKEKLKKLLKNPKVMTSPCDGLQIEMLIYVINLQLVSRVLKMSVITTQQLRFCQEKLESVRFNQGSLAICTNWCLFPYA